MLLMRGEELGEVLLVLGVAALPVSELRGAIPLALVHYGMSPPAAYALGVVGNLLPVLPLLLVLGRLLQALSRIPWPWVQKPLHWWLHTTQRRFRSAIARWGPWALVLIVAIPLPMTGAWTGCAVAALFGVPLRRAFLPIALGVLLAGLIVTLSTLGALSALQPAP